MPETKVRVYLTEIATHSFVMTPIDITDHATIADAAEGIFVASEADDLEQYRCTFSERAFSHLEEIGKLDCTQAEDEGWAIFNDYEIQRLDDQGVFDSDDAAIRFVRHRAARGSAYHQQALRAAGL